MNIGRLQVCGSVSRGFVLVMRSVSRRFTILRELGQVLWLDPAYGGTRLVREELELRRYLTLDPGASQMFSASSRRESDRVRSWRAGSLNLE